MATTGAPPRGVHLVGSLALANAEEVFRTASGVLGDRLRTLPDGETGPRRDWIGWQIPVFAQNPGLEAVPTAIEYTPHPAFRPRAGVTADTLRFDRLGYADAARESYALFARLQREGVIPAGCRFQVSLPTPAAAVIGFVTLDAMEMVEPAYEAALLDELDAILGAIPHEAVAVQWDVAVEIGVLEGVFPAPFADPMAAVIARLVRIGKRVPADVPLGYHLCYGDYQHAHFKQPADTGLLVTVANALADSLDRPLSWLHLPVPRGRSDDAYFAPLRGLRLPSDTRLYLGVVHYTDGEAGTRQRIAAAQRAVPQFGIATECGMGRRPPEQMPELLRLHAVLAGPT